MCSTAEFIRFLHSSYCRTVTTQDLMKMLPCLYYESLLSQFVFLETLCIFLKYSYLYLHRYIVTNCFLARTTNLAPSCKYVKKSKDYQGLRHQIFLLSSNNLLGVQSIGENTRMYKKVHIQVSILCFLVEIQISLLHFRI